MTLLPVGRAETRRHGKRIAILAFGTAVPICEPVAEELDATLVNMRFIKPLDNEMIDRVVATHDLIVTVEENVVAGGAGSGVNEYLAAAGQFGTINVANYGLPDRLIQHGSRDDMLRDAGLTSEAIKEYIDTRVGMLEADIEVREVG